MSQTTREPTAKGRNGTAPERIETVVIGGGQAGLATGYHLRRRGRPFVILDAGERVGDAWRHRWDSLRLFTPARYSALPGLRFPAPPHYFPTKDEMADYLEGYARRFELPVRLGARVTRLSRTGERFLVEAGPTRIEADQVVVALSSFQRPKVPAFAAELDPDLVQLHSSAYRHPGQLRPGGTLIVGAGNSGTEIAMELAATRPVWLSGRDPGHIPFDVEGRAGRVLVPVVLRGVFHRVLTVGTPMGRRLRPWALRHSGPLVRTKPRQLRAAGVTRAPRTVGVRDGRPVLEGGEVLDVANVIWCTGYGGGLEWIDLPVHGELEPRHERGVARDVPGLYFVGLFFQYSLSSEMIHGVGRDAARIARAVAARAAKAAAAGPSAARTWGAAGAPERSGT